MKKLLPLILAIIGTGAGVGAGMVLTPAPADPGDPCGTVETAHEIEFKAKTELEHDYVKMNNQFIVPVVNDDRVKALVVMTLSLEVAKGAGEQVYVREPKLRDAFLRVMFDHANSDGFDGDFTSNGNLAHLRETLLGAGRDVLGPLVSEVLIVDIVRQDN